MNLTSDWVGKWARYSPDKIAFQDGVGTKALTYSQASRAIDHICSNFAIQHQIERGDRIAVIATNLFEYVLLFFVAQKLGAILVPINFRLSSRETQHILSDAQPKLLIAESTFFEGIPEAYATLDFSDYIQLVSEGTESNTTFRERGSFEDPCLILYTSGTTGAPKGAVLTNQSIFWNSVNTSLRLNLKQEDWTVNFAPFFHTGGWNVLTLPFIHRGGSVVLLPKFDEQHILNVIEKYGVTIFFGVPTTLQMMSDSKSFARADLSSVRYAIVGGEPMPIEAIRTWQNRGVPIRQGYGLTEFGPNVFSLNEEHSATKIGSVGFANFYTEVKVVRDDGTFCQPGEIGELALKGPMSMLGYWRNERATAETIRDGWLYTGDLVRQDEDGFFYIVGRKKEMFISGGENVYPAEIEKVLHGILGVKEAAVIGVPDPKWGEVGRAFVVLENPLSEQEILEISTRSLAKYKVPKRVVFLDELPKGDSGKIQKKRLTESHP